MKSARPHEHRNALLQIKSGQQPWPEVNAWRLRLHKEFDYRWANEFLLKARREMVR